MDSHITAKSAAVAGCFVVLIVVLFAFHRLASGTGLATSRDNASLIPSRDAGLYLVSGRGGQPTRVTAKTRLPFDAEDPAWSPDGRSLAFTGTPCGGCGPAIYVVNLHDMRVRRLTSGSHPAWSRRGWIAFVRRGADGVDRIYLMTQNGRNIHALFRSGANGSQPSWSPDGRKIAFVRLVGDPQHGNPQIFVTNPYETGAADLAYDPSAVEGTPAWSPNGRHIAFGNVGPRGYWEIYVMSSDGTGKQRLVSLDGNVTAPSWSPDGKRLVVESDTARQPGFPSLYVVRADGSGLALLTKGTAEDFSPAWSWDGARIAFSHRPLVRIADGGM